MIPQNHTLVPVPLSATSEETLKAYAKIFANSLDADAPLAGIELPELTSAIAHRRDHFSRRAVFIATDASALKAKLEAFANGEAAADAADDVPASVISGNELGAPKIAFTFSGQGSQWWAMGRALLEKEPVYRKSVEDFDALFAPLAGWSVIDAMMEDESSSQVDRSAVTQPTICALQIALAALWRHRGVVPDMVIGHSLGEVAAAHVAGAIDLETAVRYIHTRSLIGAKASGQGAMAVVGLAEDELASLLPSDGSIEIAGYNAPTTLTITGDASAIESFIASLNAERPEVFTRGVKTDTAWHSHLLEAGEAWFRAAVGEIAYKTPTIPFVSTVTG
ncbi:MAG: acyltransferase domain-containing protein, partial [Hyphomicrobium sp.]